MTSSGHSSDEDFLESLGISLDTDLTADADTHTSVTSIYAQGDLKATQVARFTLLLLFASTFWSNRKEKFSSSTPVLSVSRRWLSLQAPDIYAGFRQGDLKATQVARFTLLLLFASTFWSNRKEKFNPSILKSLEDLAHLQEYDWAGAILSRMYDDMCDLSRHHCKVEVGAMTARLQSWIQADPHFQRSDALSRRRVVLSHPVLRRYYLGERVDLQIRRCRSVPYPPLEDMQAGKQMTLTDAHTEGVPHVEFILGGDSDELCRVFLMQPIGSRLDSIQRSAPSTPLTPNLLGLRVPRLGLQGGGLRPILLLPLRLRVHLGLGLAARQVLPGLPVPSQMLLGLFTQIWPTYISRTTSLIILQTVPDGLVCQMMELILGMVQERRREESVGVDSEGL
ncbi:hypothetical protein JCGZ_22045 [Jatropha curcas]|uniref:Aminotransferase-like plant mobile domain-containing protein n=1 Tax=Jatropha curcas TaxID=180498 RepID=A0A067L833_JATCU|nr:hypothetical protein JCGZ_22045 [Jatropha curcas]